MRNIRRIVVLFVVVVIEIDFYDFCCWKWNIHGICCCFLRIFRFWHFWRWQLTVLVLCSIRNNEFHSFTIQTIVYIKQFGRNSHEMVRKSHILAVFLDYHGNIHNLFIFHVIIFIVHWLILQKIFVFDKIEFTCNVCIFCCSEKCPGSVSKRQYPTFSAENIIQIS